MTPEREQELITADTAAHGAPIVLRHLPRATVEADQFDLYVTVRHGQDDKVLPETVYAIAKELRGNQPVSDKIADWHVRSIEALRFLSDQGDHPREGEVIGTRIWFSQTYCLSPGYTEKV